MSFFEKLNWEAADGSLFRRVRKLSGMEWSTDHQAIKDLRDRLLELQNRRCVYCQAPISSDENGYRELEHILPKKASKNYSLPNCISNDVNHRRNTAGYSSFTYEPKNLALSCKQCNTNKGNYDPLRDRTRSPKYYPREGAFEWVHPYWAEYSKHIKLNRRNWTYAKKTEEGDRVIKVCKLDKSQTLIKKFEARAHARAKHAKAEGLSTTLYALASSVLSREFGVEQAVIALVSAHPIMDAEARILLKLWIARVRKDSAIDHAKASAALRTVMARIRKSKGKVI